MTLEIRRGDVVRVRLDPTVGHEISKTRPAVVISNDLACRYDTVVQIVPVTGLRKKPVRRYEAKLDSAESGLDKPSRALANLRSAASSRRSTRMPSSDIAAAVQALRTRCQLPADTGRRTPAVIP